MNVTTLTNKGESFITTARKIRYGMVGGGPGAFIGDVHRKAAALDGIIELVAGAFASSAERSRRQGKALHLPENRVYDNYEEMARRESLLPDDERIDFVSIVTPNDTHYSIAKTFIEKGFHVVCDKPMTLTIEEADDLVRLVQKHNVIFAVTYNYSGYPMIQQARELVREGLLGTIRKIVVEYPQGWLATPAEHESKQAAWRTDPSRAGVSSCMGDIGSHAEHLVRYVTGLRIEKLCADLTTFVPGRPLDDDGNVLLRFNNGARGILYASQISVGEQNNLTLRVYGTEASVEWRQERPNTLIVKHLDAPTQIYERGNDYLSDVVKQNSRLPSGHPEGFIEAFANIYRNVARAINTRTTHDVKSSYDDDFPTVVDGAIGVHFIHKVVESSRSETKWTPVQYDPPSS